jgi:hypothetical protein
MNRSIENLASEREAARAAVERFAPITVAWAFEAEPASAKPLLDFYLDAVRTCDLFLLIVGEQATKPVRDEVQVARDYGRPMLVFRKEGVAPTAEAADLLRTIPVKYDTFTNAVELREKIGASLGTHLLSLIRREPTAAPQLGDRLARLRRLQEKQRPVRILPTVPACQYNSFTVEEVTPTTVRFQKSGLANVSVPAERIEDVLETGEHEPPTVQVNGRLQWLTAHQNWYFRPERPPASDPLGIGLGKEAPRQPTFSQETMYLLRAHPHDFYWSNPEDEGGLGGDVFFDEDGRHLTNCGRILICKRRF